MTEGFYVATDRNGVEHGIGTEIAWQLPTWDGISWHESKPTHASSAVLTLRTAQGLLDALDEAIFVAKAVGQDDLTSDKDGITTTSAAILISKTKWDLTTAAQFALDCAEHVAGDLGSTTLPDGSTIDTVIDDARRVLLQTAADEEHRLGRLARLSAARRLKKQGNQLSDIARELLSDDLAHDLDALDDPNYAKTAAIVDAVLAAVETIRHLALPRYFATLEGTSDGHDDDEPSPLPSLITTPWGPISLGAEHHQPYAASWIAARDAASRARVAVHDQLGAAGEEAERSWQAARLEAILQTN